ncbi:MAG: DUF3419 family protein [Chloroflexi bacterium]|nr:DUF3419 family protein [Chloroflexota bacterium]
MYNPPFKSDIFYSVQNEDYQTELVVLHRLDRGAPLRVLMVASSGENILSLLTFWEARREREVAFGIHHVGRNDVGMHDIQDGLRAAGFEPLQHPLQDEELPAWRAVYTELITAAYIRDLFGLPSEELAAKIASIAGYLGECHFHALRQPHSEHNPFVTTVFANAYATAADEAGFPLYLQMDGQAALQRLGTRERLRLHSGNILEQMTPLAAAYGPFDLISLSNIADWMNEAQFGATVRQARECLRSDGALLARTATGRPMIGEVMGQHMHMDHKFNAELQRVERGPWFRTIAAGFWV